MSYPICRPMNSTELAAVATGISTIEGQGTRIRAIIVPQQTILSCHCSGTLSTNDAVTDIPMSVLSGTVAHVVNGMTGYIGSSAGARDLGMIRVKSATSSSIHCGRVSGINWSTSVYITIVDDFGIRLKQPSFTAPLIMLDDDIAYTDQNTNMYPIPILGPDRAISFTSGCAMLDGSNSYTLDGTSIVSYLWSVTNAGTSSGSLVSPASASTTWIPSQTGSYILALTVTSSNGKSTTGHRNLYIYDESGSYVPQANVTLDNITMERDAGGATAKIKAWEGIDISTVPDRSKIILIADDFYGGSALNIGQVPGCEKTLFVGWMSTEMDEYDRNVSSGDFDLAGPHYWLEKITDQSTFLYDMTTATTWVDFNNLVPDKILYHLLMWRSTAMEVMDCYPTLDTRHVGGVSMGIDSIWAQLKNNLTTRWMIYIVCDRYGRFMPYLNPQLQANRSSIPNVQTWTKDDFGETVKLNRTVTPSVGMQEVAAGGGGIDAIPATMYWSRAPGTITYAPYGSNDMNDSLTAMSQSEANYLSGALLAWKNNIYASIGLVLAENNKMLDIAPAMYATMSASPSDSIGGRGVTLTNLRVLFNRLVYRVDDKGAVTIEVDCEGETTGIDGYTVVQQQEPISNLPPTSGSQVTIPITPLVTPGSWFPPTIPNIPTGTPTACLAGDQPNGPFNLVFDKVELYSGESTYAWCHCWLRKTTSSNRSRIDLFMAGDNNTFTVQAVDANKNVIIDGIIGDRDPYGFYPVYFGNASDTEVWGFVITCLPMVCYGTNGTWQYMWIEESDIHWNGRGNASAYGNIWTWVLPQGSYVDAKYCSPIHPAGWVLGGAYIGTSVTAPTWLQWGPAGSTDRYQSMWYAGKTAMGWVDGFDSYAYYTADRPYPGTYPATDYMLSQLLAETGIIDDRLWSQTRHITEKPYWLYDTNYGDAFSHSRKFSLWVRPGALIWSPGVWLNGPQPIYNICGVSS